MQIRPATLEDVADLIQMGYCMFRESTFTGTFDSARMAQRMVALIQRDTGVVLVAEHNARLIGGIAAWVEDGWCSDAVLAYEQAVYVEPAARSGTLGARLIQAYVDWAKSQHATEIWIGNSAGIINDNHYDKFISRLGFTRTGGLYVSR